MRSVGAGHDPARAPPRPPRLRGAAVRGCQIVEQVCAGGVRIRRAGRGVDNGFQQVGRRQPARARLFRVAPQHAQERGHLLRGARPGSDPAWDPAWHARWRPRGYSAWLDTWGTTPGSAMPGLGSASAVARLPAGRPLMPAGPARHGVSAASSHAGAHASRTAIRRTAWALPCTGKVGARTGGLAAFGGRTPAFRHCGFLG